LGWDVPVAVDLQVAGRAWLAHRYRLAQVAQELPILILSLLNLIAHIVIITER
jgi:hypothetical protein